MSYRSNNAVLPTEILKIIFGYLEAKKKEDNDTIFGCLFETNENNIKACRLVCKSWELAAESYLDHEISLLVVSDSSLSTLLNDISYFSQKVTAVTFSTSFVFTRYNSNQQLSIFTEIINQCPNLISFTFGSNNTCFYLQSLYSSRVKLNKIQEIRTSEDLCYLTKRLYLQVNFKYCSTITRLSISKSNFSHSSLEGKPISNLISKFPSLIYFEGSFSMFYTNIAIYLDQVFISSPHLQEFNLYGIGHISGYESNEKGILQDSKLTTLRITAEFMTIDALKFITENLKQVRCMVLLVEGEILPMGGLGPIEAKNILNAFESYTLNMKNVEIRYRYRNKVFKHKSEDHLVEGELRTSTL